MNLFSKTLILTCLLVGLTSKAIGQRLSAGTVGGGGGNPEELTKASLAVEDPISAVERQELELKAQKDAAYNLHRERIELGRAVTAWADLTESFFAFLYYTQYPYKDQVILSLTPKEVKRSFRELLKDAISVEGNIHFKYGRNLQLNKQPVLFITDREAQSLTVDIDFWNRLFRVPEVVGDYKTDYMDTVDFSDLKKLPTVKVMATLLHEVLVYKGLEASQTYTHSIHFRNALENFFESDRGWKYLQSVKPAFLKRDCADVSFENLVRRDFDLPDGEKIPPKHIYFYINERLSVLLGAADIHSKAQSNVFRPFEVYSILDIYKLAMWVPAKYPFPMFGDSSRLESDRRDYRFCKQELY